MLSVFLCFVSASDACSCDARALFNFLPSIDGVARAKLRKAELVEVTRAAIDPTPIKGEAEVVELIWGTVPDVVQVSGYGRGHTCSRPLIVGDSYLLLYRSGEIVNISACSLSKRYTEFGLEEMRYIIEFGFKTHGVPGRPKRNVKPEEAVPRR